MKKLKAKVKTTKKAKRKPGINSRRKGAVGEVEFAHYLTDHGLPAERGQQHAGGVESPDVKCPSLPHTHFEVKRVQAGSPYKWLEQAVRDAGKGKLPAVAHRRNGKEWIAIVPMEDYVRMLILVERHHAELPAKQRDPDAELLGE